MKNIRLSFRAHSGGPLRIGNYPRFVNYLRFGVQVWEFTEVWELLVPEVLEIKVRVVEILGLPRRK